MLYGEAFNTRSAASFGSGAGGVAVVIGASPPPEQAARPRVIEIVMAASLPIVAGCVTGVLRPGCVPF
jgi:hypothetical protein